MSRIPTLSRAADSQPLAPAATSLTSAATLDVPFGLRLADIPLAGLSEHRAWSATGQWQGVFDCALWLRTPQGLSQPVQLVVYYIDNQGQKMANVDRCAAGRHRTVLLNGSVTLAVSGRVRAIAAYLIGAHPRDDIAVEEWHFAPQQRREV